MHRRFALLLAGSLALVAGVAPCQTFVRKIPDLPSLAWANDVAVDSAGNLWVVTDLDDVVKISPTGQELLRFGRQFRAGPQPAFISRPFSVAAGVANDVFLTTQNYILRFDLNGNCLGTIGGSGTGNGQFTGLGKIVVAANGDVLAVDIGGHRVQRFDAQGNFLLAFGSAGTGPGQFDFVDSFPMFTTGVAEAPNHDIYVVDRGNLRVQRFDAAGTWLASFPVPFAPGFTFSHTDLVIDAQSNLFLGHLGSPAIWKYDTAGTLLQTLSSVPVGSSSRAPSGLGIDPAGNVYCAFGSSGGGIVKLSPGLAAIATLGTVPRQVDGEFSFASSVWYEPNGDLLVADQTLRLQRCDANGAFVSKGTWSGMPVGTSVAVGQPVARDSAGFLYCLGSSSGVGRVLKFTAAGAWVQTIGSFMTDLRGLAVDAAGNLYVGTATTVTKTDPAGNALLSIPSNNLIGALAVDATGRIYIGDYSNSLLKIHDPAGVVIQTITVPNPRSVLVDGSGRILVGTFGSGIYIYNSTGIRLVRFGIRGGGEGAFLACVGLALQNGKLAIADSTHNRVQIYDVELLDQDRPTVTITSPIDGSVIDGDTVTIEATVVDASSTTVTSNPTGLFLQLPPGVHPVTTTFPYPVLGAVDSSAIFGLTAVDSSNPPSGASVTVIRDVNAPTNWSVSYSDNQVIGTDTVNITFSVYDYTSKTVTVSHGGGTHAQAGIGYINRTVTVSGLVNGPNAITFTATDAVGHTSTYTRTIIADLTAPIVQFVGLGGPGDPDCFGPGQSPLPVTAQVTDFAQTLLSSTPSASWGSWLPAGGGTRTANFNLVQGLNSITVRAQDQYGRQSSVSTTVLYDLMAPTAAFDAPTANQLVRGSMHVVVDASDPLPDSTPGCGVASVALALDGNAVGMPLTEEPYELDLDTTPLADGAHTLTAVVTDGVGNVRTISVPFVTDNTAPVVNITAPVANAIVGGNDLPFAASASDAGGLAAITMQVGSGAPNDTDGSTTFATPVANASVASVYDTIPLADGSLLLRVTARDAAGNEAAAEVTVVVDNTAPEKALVSPTDGATVTGLVPIVATANDPNLTSLVIKVDGNVVGSTASNSLTVNFDTVARGEGPMTIEVIVTDAANNSSSCTATVNVVNLTYDFDPDTLSLKNKGQGVVTAHLEGPTVANLLPVAAHRIELRVQGGNAVSALGAGGVGDSDADLVPDLTIRFDRAALINSIKAGILGNFLPADGVIAVELWIDGHRAGSSPVRVKS